MFPEIWSIFSTINQITSNFHGSLLYLLWYKGIYQFICHFKTIKTQACPETVSKPSDTPWNIHRKSICICAHVKYYKSRKNINCSTYKSFFFNNRTHSNLLIFTSNGENTILLTHLLYYLCAIYGTLVQQVLQQTKICDLFAN